MRAWGGSTCWSTTRASTPTRRPARTTRSTSWEHVLRTNLTGYLLHAKAAAKRMTAGGRGGSIVNVSSISGASALGRGNLAFGVSKAGVDQLTRELAVEWAPRGIRVNSILPCQFLNAGLRGLVADPARTRTVERMIGGIPMGRMGEPEEIVGPDPVPGLARGLHGHGRQPAGGRRQPRLQRRRQPAGMDATW